MKFQIIEQVKSRNDIILYFNDITNLTNYKIFIGIINNYFGILLSKDNFQDEIFIDNITQIKYNNQIKSLSFLPKIITNIEKNSEKFIELFNNSNYIRFPISNETIEWLKSSNDIIIETVEMYNKISLPYINSILDKNTKWINDLLFNKTEEDRIIFRNNNFVITKDIIWKDDNLSNFYILAIPIKSIKTIRDLSKDDIELLINMKNKVNEILRNYNINNDNIIMFFHYHPSYYQLHMHICNRNSIIDDNEIYRHFYIDEIISKLSNDSDYWKNTTLKFELMSNSKLYKLLKN